MIIFYSLRSTESNFICFFFFKICWKVEPVSEVIVSIIAFSQHATQDNQHDETCFAKKIITANALRALQFNNKVAKAVIGLKKMRYPLVSRYYKIICLSKNVDINITETTRVKRYLC